MPHIFFSQPVSTIIMGKLSWVEGLSEANMPGCQVPRHASHEGNWGTPIRFGTLWNREVYRKKYLLEGIKIYIIILLTRLTMHVTAHRCCWWKRETDSCLLSCRNYSEWLLSIISVTGTQSGSKAADSPAPDKEMQWRGGKNLTALFFIKTFQHCVFVSLFHQRPFMSVYIQTI